MAYCEKCETEYEEGEECLCRQYRRWMEAYEYSKVPEAWIRQWWDEELYCPKCKTSYWPSEECMCSINRMLKAAGHKIPPEVDPDL